MNRRLIAGIASVAVLVAASLTAQESYAIGLRNKCGGQTSCSGGLVAKLKASRCCGTVRERNCSGGLLAKLRAHRASKCCAPEPTCCAPAPAPCCAEVAPAPCCEQVSCCKPKRRLVVRRASRCCQPAPCCTGCGSVSSGCPNCSTTTDGGQIEEAPADAPPAPTPDAAADAPSA